MEGWEDFNRFRALFWYIYSAFSVCHQRCQPCYHEQWTWDEISHGGCSLRSQQRRQTYNRSRLRSKCQSNFLSHPKIQQKSELQRKLHVRLWQSEAISDWSQYRRKVYAPTIQRSTESLSRGKPEDFWFLSWDREEIRDGLVSGCDEWTGDFSARLIAEINVSPLKLVQLCNPLAS